MLTVTGLWFDHERAPVGLDHTPVFGWQLEGNCRNIRQTQYRLQVALTPDFAALLYDCNLVRRTEKGRLRRRGWGLRWEKAQKGGKGTNLRGFFED